MKSPAVLALIVSTLLLQGCIGAVVVGTAAVATKTATDPRSVGAQVDDTTLTARVDSAIFKDQQLKKEARIIATSYQGKVLLTGQAPTQELVTRAKQIALGVEGVIEVYNEVRLGKPVSLAAASVDSWITTKLRTQLLASNAVKSSNIKVTTENSEVFLLGLVTEQEGNVAAQIASKISGVKHVTKAFSYIK